jgi:hypothetical protein
MCFLILSTYHVNVAFGLRPAFSIYTPKDVMLDKWKNLCDRHPSLAYYEVIGQSIQGQDIYLFAIGNPQGGIVMYDGQLESQDSEALHILQYNFNLFIPIVNIDTTNRQNMRREYILSNGNIIHIPYGVDLNRNGVYGWGQSGSGDPTNNYNYRGLSPASEPETQAIRFALQKYHPQIYLNTHIGASYILHRSRTPFEEKIKELIITYSIEQGVTPYSIRFGLGSGLIATDADESFGASGWLIEIESTQNLPDNLEDFLHEYYPRLFAIFLAFNRATEIAGALTHTLEYDGVIYLVSTLSNSTLSNLTFNQPLKEIRFDVTGQAGTKGFCNITFPIQLLGGPYVVLIDDSNVTAIETNNATHTSLYVPYTHSTHTVEIVGLTVNTEFPTIIAIMISLTVLTLTLITIKRKIIQKYLARAIKIACD